MGTMRASLRGFWDDARGYQRLAYLVGAALIMIGLAHAGMWAVAGGSASGPLSWRKPTTFGISFGLTTEVVPALVDVEVAVPHLSPAVW